MYATRPTKLTDELIEECRKYVESRSGMDSMPPSVAGLSVAVKVNRTTLHNWRADYTNASGDENGCGMTEDELKAKKERWVEFCNIFDDLQARQEEKLLDGGLSNSYNSTITKLILTKHGYTDRVENSGEQVIRQTVINRFTPDQDEGGDEGVGPAQISG